MKEEENGRSRKIYHFPRVRKSQQQNEKTEEVATDLNESITASSEQISPLEKQEMPEKENGVNREIPSLNGGQKSDREKVTEQAVSRDINDRISADIPPIAPLEEQEIPQEENGKNPEISNLTGDKNLDREEVTEQVVSPNISEQISASPPPISPEKEEMSEEEKWKNRKIYHYPRVRKSEREKARNKQFSHSTTVPRSDSPMQLARSLTQKQRSLLIEAGVVAAIAFILIFIMPPLLTVLGQAFRVSLLGRFLALAIVALGIDLIWGYTGMLSLGHGVFFALGGYVLAMHLKLQIPADASIQLPEFMTLYGVTELPWFWKPFYSFPLTAVGVFIIPSVLGAVLGYLVFRNRIKGVYFSILTQAATIVFFNFFNGQQKLFNGTNGLTDFKTLLGANVSNNQTQFGFYTLTVLLLAAAYALCRWLTSGRFGRLLIALRDDEPRTRFSGYDPTGFKVLVFAISAGLAGIAGAMFTVQTGLISPKAMDIAFSIEMVIWVAVGGRASLVGAVLGAIAVNFGKSILSEQFPEVWLFFQGALFLIVVTVLPDGVVGWLRTEGIEKVRSLFGLRKYAVTYPSLEENPEVQIEREELETED